MPKDQPIASPEAEQSIIGAVLVTPDKMLEIIDLLLPDDFYYGNHRKIYQAMCDLVEADIAIDFSTVAVRLREKGELETVGGIKFLTGLTDQCGFATNAKHYVQKVQDKSVLRRLESAALTTIKDCNNASSQNVQDILDKAQSRITEVIDSAKLKTGKNMARRIRDFAAVTEGNFGVTELYKTLGIVTTGNKKSALMAVGRLVKEGVLSRIKPGYYRLTDKETTRLKLSDAMKQGDEIEMRYPLSLEKWFITYPKSIVLFSGEPDSGKTAMLLNVAQMNMHLAPVYYWTSEMGLSELYSRCEKFEGFNAREWDEKIVFAERDADFGDLVNLYPDAIHIIDNLEMHDDFYKVGGLIDAIWKALNRGVAIIGLHKDPGKVYPQGGMAALKRPRLVVDLKPKKGGGNIAEVTKAKNWRDQMVNIKGKQFEYKLIKGCRIIEWE